MNDYMKDSVNSAKKFTDRPEIKDIKRDVKSLRDSSAKLAHDVKDGASVLAKEGKEYLKNRSANDIQRIETYVKEHPAKSLAIAVAGGMLLTSFLFGGRKG
jgi:ElaB/YqjD/DUF883 family membrane-anchored ribosome-binding protein